jgi:hypothetical protein
MDEVFEHDGVSVRHRLRPARQDRKHLVVVFAGVQAGKHDFFGFDGSALDHVKGSVLWIKDSFENHNSYYLCAGLDFKIERAVAALIDATLNMLELDAADCTLLGGSKGGSAALHLGLKYDYRNIVSSVPQTLIGTYTRQKLPETFSYMAGSANDLAESVLNGYLSRLIASPRSFGKNIYIISSEADPEFAIHIQPRLKDLSNFSNFNLLLTDSTLVKSHPEVTPYNIPFILSTIYALCEGVAPRYGVIGNGNGKRDRERASSYFLSRNAVGLPIAAFHWVQIKGNVLKFRAYGAVIGENTNDLPAEQPFMLALRGKERYKFELEAIQDKSLNSKLYKEYYRDYVWAGLRSPNDLGISLDALPTGVFDLAAAFTGPSGPHEAPLTAKPIQMTGFFAGFAYHLDASSERTRLTKTSLDGCIATDEFFKYTKLEIDGATVFVQGSFAVPREEMRRWDEGSFALSLSSNSETYSFDLAASRVGHLPRGRFIDDQAYAWANFATPSNKGLALGSLTDGEYDGRVSFIRNGRVYTGSERFRLRAAAGEYRIE